MQYSNKYQNKNHLIPVKRKLKGSLLHFGKIGLILVENGYLKDSEWQTCSDSLDKKIKSKGTLVKKVTPFLGVTAKPNGTRMGKGKGSMIILFYQQKKEWFYLKKFVTILL